ncbi:uncharacterized protein [Euwallacea fornicatus]|uniref:uncharacterized protein isoform X2 n=1 Tax=Euwallacea fornicatus TaxID=995702 RepID=UPI0033906E9A
MSTKFTLKTKEFLVDKILEQGQKLRTAMVQSILQNDPLHSDILYSNNKYYTPITNRVSLTGSGSGDKKLLEAFLNGDYLTKDEEKIALSIVRSMPGLEIFKTTKEKLFSKCPCSTCSVYHTNNLKCDLKRNEAAFKHTEHINNINALNVLKQVDSLKILLQSIHLNSLGEKKIVQSFNKSSSHLNETFFVKYCIPEVFICDIVKSKSKVDSGLEHNQIQVCSRRTSNVIYLKQAFIHSVCNLHNCNLEEHDLIFIIRYKSSFQNKSEQLGIAKFNFGVFNNTKNASSGKTLSIYLNETSSISVGTIKVTIQLGAGKLYFGQEFIGAALQRENSAVTISSSDEGTEGNLPCNNQIHNVGSLKHFIDSRGTTQKLPKEQISSDNQQEPINNNQFQQKKRQQFAVVTQTSKIVNNLDVAEVVAPETEAELLFGFLYVSEARFLNNSLNTFIKCQPYCENTTSISRVVYGSSRALYNFLQIIPLLYEENLLLKLRENFMIIEFWEKLKSTEEILGLTRLPLHQFYLGYRNGVILKHLKRNILPIIGTDWWEPIYSIDSNELIGQVQVLTALGTENQIKNLQQERGFKDASVKAKLNVTPNTKNPDTSKVPSSYFTDKAKVNRKSNKLISVRKLSSVSHPPINIPKSSGKRKVVKLDVGVQSDMDLRINSNTGESSPQMLDTITSFLKLLEKTQKPPCAENSTNTELQLSSGTSIGIPNSEQPQLRKTSDLLDSLQKALSLDTIPAQVTPQMAPHFKAEILVNAANNLPSRRKIKSKSKRTKVKLPKHEENILPSTYVTFETMPGCPLKVTNVFPKCTSPKWNFKCQVFLPVDLIQNGEKRLIFKVWQKCTNAVLQPNMQTDLVLGFAALDLSILASLGLPNIQGWFNIIDFSGKCNGQINIHINPLEKLAQTASQISNDIKISPILVSPVLEQVDEGDCNELLGRALKRKFNELDEITQRLRLRLSQVVSEDSDDSSDDITEEFEHDINNLCIEEDFDLIDFEEEARKFNVNYSHHKAEKRSQAHNTSLSSGEPQPGSSKDCYENNNCRNTGHVSEVSGVKNSQSREHGSGLLMENKNTEKKSESISLRSIYSSRSLADGKHRIDSLLEKLTLLTSEATQPVSMCYVSNCSTATNEADDIKDIFKDLEQHSRPNITATNSFDPVLFQQLYGGSACDSSPQNTDKTIANNKLNNGDSSERNDDGSNVGNSSLNNSKSNESSKVCVTNGSDETSMLSSFSDCRPNPIDEGSCEDEKRFHVALKGDSKQQFL